MFGDGHPAANPSPLTYLEGAKRSGEGVAKGTEPLSLPRRTMDSVVVLQLLLTGHFAH